MTVERPPYRAAIIAAVAVLVVYLITLAPTVTFWDAGEFIAAAKTLGIPHPPGTPLFVLMAHVWGLIFPLGGYAFRQNLLSALLAAVAAGCWFLVANDAVVHQHGDVDAESRRAFGIGAGAAAAALTAFGFTTWQNATETEVYSAAMCTIALVAWLTLRWRATRVEPRSARLLLLILFLGAISVAIHLMALLVGPAVILAIALELRGTPAEDRTRARQEWAQLWFVGAAWLLLIAIGLGSGPLTALAAVITLGAALLAVQRRQFAFVLVALVIVVIGVSPYLFLLLRARQGPWLNEANPGTWHALLDVIRRAQYPVRTPLDDPTVFHGAGNPGRTITLFDYQLANYGQYFDWQWARAIGAPWGASPVRLVITLLMATIGVHGAFAQKRGDRTSFALVAGLFLMTGIGLVIYMNFKPGPALGWARWPDLWQHEVRDRDYFFVGSFVAWGVWVAIGLTDLIRTWLPRLKGRAREAVLGVYAVALIPLVANFPAATRRQIPDATFARDFAAALLQSVPQNGILFTWGDNDTFPLWYAQAVEGIRPDVTVVCLALAETPWYLKELRNAGGESPLHDMSDSTIDNFRPFRPDRDVAVTLPNGDVATILAGSAVYGRDLLVLHVMELNAGKRSLAWSVTDRDVLFGLEPHLVQQGMALVMPAGTVLGTAGGVGRGGASLDVATTRWLADSVWQYGGMLHGDPEKLDPDVRALADMMAVPIAQTGRVLVQRGDTAAGVALLDRAVALAADSSAEAALRWVAGSSSRP